MLAWVLSTVFALTDVSVGWQKTYSHPLFATSIRTPIEGGKLVDINAWPADRKLPARFLLGDGSIRRAVILVDQTAGSALDRRLNESAAKLSGDNAPERLRSDLADVLGAQWSLGQDEVGDNPWDPPPPVATALELAQEKDLASLVVGGPPRPTDRRLPIVPLERFLEEPSSAYCIQKALLARLLLERLGIASRYVAGAKLFFTPGQPVPRNYGHSWVQLADGQVLDPTNHLLMPPGAAPPSSRDWFWLQDSYRLENQYYPILVLE